MFEYIKGTLQYKGTDFCVIDVGGIGFKIYTSYMTAANIGQSGQTVTLYTYMNVKEDEISLFGFASKEELSVFTMLISVSGVGPKVGVAVLASMAPAGYISNDAVSALMVLGYSSKEAARLTAKVYKDGMTLEETVRQALRQGF